jgi:integral membrane sensor domain MASE1
MGLYLTTIAGLVVWIVLWAIGFKSFDGFLITLVMVLIAAAARIFGPYLPGNRGNDQGEPTRPGGSWISR